MPAAAPDDDEGLGVDPAWSCQGVSSSLHVLCFDRYSGFGIHTLYFLSFAVAGAATRIFLCKFVLQQFNNFLSGLEPSRGSAGRGKGGKFTVPAQG